MWEGFDDILLLSKKKGKMYFFGPLDENALNMYY